MRTEQEKGGQWASGKRKVCVCVWALCGRLRAEAVSKGPAHIKETADFRATHLANSWQHLGLQPSHWSYSARVHEPPRTPAHAQPRTRSTKVPSLWRAISVLRTKEARLRQIYNKTSCEETAVGLSLGITVCIGRQMRQINHHKEPTEIVIFSQAWSKLQLDWYRTKLRSTNTRTNEARDDFSPAVAPLSHILRYLSQDLPLKVPNNSSAGRQAHISFE